MDKHYLSFIPYSLSLERCLFLMPVNRAEMEYFLSFKDRTHSVQFTFDSDIFGQSVEFLLWGRLNDIRKANPYLNMVLVEDHPQLIVNGPVISEEESDDVENYRFLDFAIDFNPYLSEIMSHVLSGGG